MNNEQLQSLLVTDLQKFIFVEDMLTAELPIMIEKAQNEKLRITLQEHLEETEGQLDMLSAVFETMQLTEQETVCNSFVELINEAKQTIKEFPGLTDVVIATSALQVEHYEMGMYEAVIAMQKANIDIEIMRMLTDNVTEIYKQEETAARKLEECLRQLVSTP